MRISSDNGQTFGPLLRLAIIGARTNSERRITGGVETSDNGTIGGG